MPVVIATTPAGAARLDSIDLAPNVRVETVGDGDGVPAARLVELTAALGARLVLCEGGPHLVGDLVGAGLLDELFLTVAPQLGGRDDEHPRFGLVEGTAFRVADAPWAELASIRRSGDHLFLRYGIAGPRG